MSREAVATALDEAAEALARAAHALRGMEPSVARADVPASVPTGAAASGGGVPPASPPRRLPPKREAPDTSAFTKCPAHGKDWVDGRYGPYCPSQEPEGVEHDGNWYNDKGYCRVTPRSAAAWLKQHPKGSPTQDVDDIPF